MEVILAVIVASVVFGYITYGSKKNTLKNPNSPTDINTEISKTELSEKELLKLQVEYLKSIQYNTERTAKNTAFLTWVMIISFIITLFSLLSISSKF